MKLLLEELPPKEYKELLNNQTDWPIRLKKHYRISRTDMTDPRKDIILILHERGITYARLKEDLLHVCDIKLGMKSKRKMPKIKVAVLIGNAEYEFWPQLSTPISDCTKLKNILKTLGFLVIIIENVKSDDMKTVFKNLMQCIPEESYVLFYFGGHGFEFNGIKYTVGVESLGVESLQSVKSIISEHYIMKTALEKKPDLFICLLDICRESPDRKLNAELYKELPPVEEFKMENSNFIIGYSTSPYMPSFEKKIQHDTENQSSVEKVSNIQLDLTANTNKDTGISLYVEYLCKHLQKNIDFNEILKMVHHDIAQDSCNKMSIQKPQKSDNTNSPFYLTTKSQNDENAKMLLKNEVEECKSKGLVISIF